MAIRTTFHGVKAKMDQKIDLTFRDFCFHPKYMTSDQMNTSIGRWCDIIDSNSRLLRDYHPGLRGMCPDVWNEYTTCPILCKVIQDRLNERYPDNSVEICPRMEYVNGEGLQFTIMIRAGFSKDTEWFREILKEFATYKWEEPNG